MAEKSNPSEMVLYTTEDGTVKVDTVIKGETLWLTQKKMAELFQVKPQNITMHLKNIYAEGELSEEATCKDFLQVQTEGTRDVERRRKFYNLDAIIAQEGIHCPQGRRGYCQELPEGGRD